MEAKREGGSSMSLRNKRIALHIFIFLAAAFGAISAYGEHRDFMRLLGGFGIAYAFVILGGVLSDLKHAEKHPSK